ncbi:MAG: T9SS type A sorting domain-containing protein [Bacteroidales bacterium]|nr:T9SS type A sorting domain-containing protein [Bacteroidales bacterium]
MKTENKELATVLKVYPISTKGILKIQFKSNDKKRLTLKIYDLMLQLVAKQNIIVLNGINNNIIDVSGFHPGIYYLEISSESSTIFKKLILN